MLLEKNFQKFFELINKVYFFNSHVSKFILYYTFKLVRVKKGVSSDSKKIRVKSRRG